MATLQVFAQPTKSPNDHKDYRVIVLPNGLKAILISDMSMPSDDQSCRDESEDEESFSEEESCSESENDEEDDDDDDKDAQSQDKKQAAAALCVGVGSFSDPDAIPGLAHFLEHMVFMGSETYPDENHFDRFIQTHGGSDNACTDSEHTMYQFEINPKYFKQALQVWSKFFICPLMTFSSIDREVKAVDSEFQMALVDEQSRLEQLIGYLCQTGNPINKFLWGNEASLKLEPKNQGIDVYEALHNFRKEHYYAQNMVLAVQSNESVETLQDWVTEIFGDVPTHTVDAEEVQKNDNNNCKAQCVPVPVNESYTLCHVVPIQNIQEMHFIWFLPPVMKHYKCKPLHYTMWLISHEGKGGLLSCLKENHLATSIATNDEDRSGFDDSSLYALVSIDITLTELGVSKKFQVMDIVFAYTEMLRKSGPSSAVFKEIQQIEQNDFTYMDEDTPLNNVQTGAENLLHYAPEDVWAGDYLLPEYNPQLIQEVLDGLTPEKCMMFLYDSSNTNLSNIQKEPWFGTEFSMEKCEPNLVNQSSCNNKGFNFHLPSANQYIPTDFSQINISTIDTDSPSLLVDEPSLKAWFKPDFKFNLPKGFARFILSNPIYTATAEHQVYLNLLIEVLEYNLSEVMFDATAASFHHSTSVSNCNDLQIKISGFSHKLNLVVDALLGHLFDFSVTKEVFEEQRLLLKKSYYNKLLESNKLCKDLRLTLLERQRFPLTDKYAITDQLTLQGFQTFVKSFLMGVRAKALIQGNFTAKAATRLLEKLQGKLKESCACRVVEFDRVLMVPDAETFIKVRAMNVADDNSMVTAYLQAGPATIKDSVKLELLNTIMGEPCFDILRTKKQLGYSVYSIDHHTAGVLGLSLNVRSQNSKFSVEELTDTMHAFLREDFYQLLKNMPQDEFDEQLSALIELKTVEDTQLVEEVDRHWDEILSRDYLFDRLQREIKALESTTHREVLEYYESLVIRDPRQLTVQVRGNTPSAGSDTSPRERANLTRFQLLEPGSVGKSRLATEIKDVRAFRNTARYYPVCHTKL